MATAGDFGQQRIQRHQLPGAPTACPFTQCVYNELDEPGVCSDPRTNKGNGDAHCHKMGNARLLTALAALADREDDDG